MEKLVDCLFSLNSVALATAGFIFFITLFLTAKQWINFSVTLLLLLFALISGLVIAHLDLFRSHVHESTSEQDKHLDLKISNFEERVLKAYDNLKMEIEIQNHKLDTMHEEIENLKKQSNPLSKNMHAPL